MSSDIGISGLRAAMTNLNTTAHNVANASTVGFKNSRAEFDEVVADRQRGAGVATQTISQLFNQGSVVQTGENGTTGHLDMAIAGEGFFGVRTVAKGEGAATTQNAATEYTRAGSYHLDADGYIVNNIDQRLQGPGGDIRLSPGAQITGFDNATGQINWKNAKGETQAPQQVGLVSFINPQGLAPVGDTNWQETKSSGLPSRMNPPGTGVLGHLFGGALEASNVDLTGELVNMIIAQRDYTANAKTISSEDKMKDVAISMIR